jgi:hypothetical protein
MRGSVIRLAAVICVALAIIAVHERRMLAPVSATAASCRASLDSGGSSYKLSGSVCFAEEEVAPQEEHLSRRTARV